MMRRLLLAGIALFALSSCKSKASGSSGPHEHGQLVSAFTWPLPAAIYDGLKADSKAMIEAKGVAFVDKDHALKLASHPLPGYWVLVGDKRAMADMTGDFVLDKPAAEDATAYVLRDPADAIDDAVASFPANRLTAKGAAAASIEVAMAYQGPVGMDDVNEPGGDPLRAEEGPMQCFDHTTNTCVAGCNDMRCCLDYDGPFAVDHMRHLGDGGYDPRRYRNYLFSTCFNNVEAGICINEVNSHRYFHRTPVACFENHKYRNCQSIDGIFTFSTGAVTLNCGESADIHVHNSTFNNSTAISASVGHFNGPGWDGLWLRHFDDVARLHYVERTISFVAPARGEVPSFPVVAHLAAGAGGIYETLDINVRCESPDAGTQDAAHGPSDSAMTTTDGPIPSGDDAGMGTADSGVFPDPCNVAGNWITDCPSAAGCGQCPTSPSGSFNFTISATIAAYGGQWRNGSRYSFAPASCTLTTLGVRLSHCGVTQDLSRVIRNGMGTYDHIWECYDIASGSCMCTGMIPCTDMRQP